jgi:hypothetical protein
VYTTASIRNNKYNRFQSLQLIKSKRYVKINITEKDPHLQVADTIKCRISTWLISKQAVCSHGETIASKIKIKPMYGL